MADQGPVFGDVNQFAALVAQRERRRLIFLAFGIGISSLFALALIYLAVTSVAKAQREVTAAQQQVDVLEERRRGLENEIAVKTAQLESISSRLQSATTPQQRTEVVQAVAEQVAQGSRLVYLQFRGALSRDTMRGLQAQLQENRFSAPGIERVAKSYDNEVRYFRPEDAENARKVAAIAAQYFTQKCPPPPPRTFPVKLTPAPNQPPPPQIEIWVSMNCGE